jgi:hypothetical protein
LPGVAVQRLVTALERLMTLPKGHEYRAVADRSYRPKKAPNDEQWERAFPLYAEILAADPRRLTDNSRLLLTRRASLARHLYWLAGDYPDQLNPDFALDDMQVTRSAASSEGHTTERSRAAFMSQIRSFRAGFPELFDVRRRIAQSKQMEPVSDHEFAVALQAAETFRSPVTQARVRALLLLCRSAGADAGDCRYVTGTDIYRRQGAGLWVRLRRPGHAREVPVLERFAKPLEELARKAEAGLLVAGGATPAPISSCNELTDMLKRRMKGQHPGLLISPMRIRKAWLLEQLRTWEKLNAFLQVVGLKSMHSVEDLQRRCPPPSADPADLAAILGGLPAASPAIAGRPGGLG